MTCIDCLSCENINARKVKASSGIARWVKLHPCDVEVLNNITGASFRDQKIHRVVLTGLSLIWDISTFTNVSSVTLNIIYVPNSLNPPIIIDSGGITTNLYENETMTWDADIGKLIIGNTVVNAVDANNIVTVFWTERV